MSDEVTGKGGGHPASRWQVRFRKAVLRRWKPIARRIRPEKAHGFELQGAVPHSGEGFAFALYQSLGVRLVTGHHLTWLKNGLVFDAIEDEIRRARTSVHVVLYIWEEGSASDRVVAALVERARAGVPCRIVVDAFGSSDFEETVQVPLTQAGCDVRVFRPLPGEDKLARNHRKIMVFDGAVAITGGFGIRDNWLGDGVNADGWRDTNIRFTGPAVAEAQLAFAENWQEAGGALLPPDAFPVLDASGPASAAFVSSTGAAVTRAERLTQLMIATAQKRVWISNAYFVPPRGIVNLLCAKASAGVDVRILAPGKKSDSKTSFGAQRMEYGEMIECGVRVWEYLPSMMHAKTMVVDDELVVAGSINLDPLSLTKLDEGAIVARNPTVASDLAQAFELDCTRAQELS